MSDQPRLWGEGRSAEFQAKKAKGQFFTPPEVVEFMFEVAGAGAGWSVIDPACGDGAFLSQAVARDCEPVWGVDRDAAALAACRGRLGERVTLVEQDGLLPCGREGFDLVIGNPPFSAIRHGVSDPDVMARFELGQTVKGRAPKPPLEVLFLERFIQLARPGGTVCIILPDGLLANRRQRRVREWMLARCRVAAVVGLPRSTFRKAATDAKTSILVLRKGAADSATDAFVASVARLEELGGVLEGMRG